MPSSLLCFVSNAIVSSTFVDIKGPLAWQNVCTVYTQYTTCRKQALVPKLQQDSRQMVLTDPKVWALCRAPRMVRCRLTTSVSS